MSTNPRRRYQLWLLAFGAAGVVMSMASGNRVSLLIAGALFAAHAVFLVLTWAKQ